MRSRYCAFVVHDEGYVLRTWHLATRPASVAFDAQLRWTGLEVLATAAGGREDASGTVEFRASYVAAGRPGALHEVSRFVRVAGAWVYVRGRLVED